MALLHSSHQICLSASGLTKALPTVLSWYSKWRLAINQTKCQAVFFSRRNRAPSPIRVDSHPIPWSYSAKYLGVTLDRKLTWCRQIDETRNKILAAYYSIQPFLNNKGISFSTKLRALHAIIFSISTYAIPIWGSADPKRIKKLQGTFLRIVRSIFHIPWYIRSTQILHEFGFSSFGDIAKSYASNLRETLSTHENPSIKVLSDYSPKPTDRYPRPCSLSK